jgi:hypothetical protein
MQKEWILLEVCWKGFGKCPEAGTGVVQEFSYGSGKLGGRVSENYISMGRLCCWFYASMQQLALDQTCEGPKCPFDNWTILHNQGWLEARGLDKKGLTQELRKRVAIYIMQEVCCPQLLHKGEDQASMFNS